MKDHTNQSHIPIGTTSQIHGSGHLNCQREVRRLGITPPILPRNIRHHRHGNEIISRPSSVHLTSIRSRSITINLMNRHGELAPRSDLWQRAKLGHLRSDTGSNVDVTGA
jgi:hypothetical protein